MVAPADPTSLQLLRHRFLMEHPDLVTQWLWEEHPQTAAFLLNWLGAPPVLAAYMTPLPALQQADVLHRIASLGVDHQPTAFHEEMAVHGRFGQPCPVCGAPVQRVVKGENEFNYCPKCQTGGKILADRALSRLLRGDWPDTLEALERPEEKREG